MGYIKRDSWVANPRKANFINMTRTWAFKKYAVLFSYYNLLVLTKWKKYQVVKQKI